MIASGSTGNSVLYHDSILVDCGVTYKVIEKYINNISIILLTHEHKDHINISTIKKAQLKRPSIRVGCCNWMLKHLDGVRNIDVYNINENYDYGSFLVSPIKAYHDIPNCGYRIVKGEHKALHITDTGHLDGITAKDYDLLAIEYNYDNEKVSRSIRSAELSGLYDYSSRVIETHLSWEQAQRFIFENAKESTEIVRLHESNRNL